MEPSLTQLLASLLLSESHEGIRSRFYPWARRGIAIENDADTPFDQDYVRQVRSALFETIGNPKWIDQQDMWAACRAGPFSLFPQDSLDLDEVEDLWMSVGTKNLRYCARRRRW